MNHALKHAMEHNTRKFNPDIVNGYGMHQIPKTLEFLDAIIRIAMRSVKIDLVYDGYKVLTPEEEFESNTRNTKKIFDISKSDIRKIELIFRFEGERVYGTYLYIPFVRRGGIMYMSGTKWYLTPVLTDNVISSGPNKIFVKLMIDKLNFHTINHPFTVNGESKVGQVLYSEDLHRNKNSSIDNLGGRTIPPVAMYLFAKHGFFGAFTHYNTTRPIFRHIKDTKDIEKTHDIFYTSGIMIKKLKNDIWKPSEYAVCIEKGTYGDYERNLIYGFIYVFDLFPSKAKEMIDIITTSNNEREIWLLLLGRIVFKDAYTYDHCVNSVETHFIRLEESYMNEIDKSKLPKDNIFEIVDFFDLLAVLVGEQTKFMTKGNSYKTTNDNRFIDLLYYILYDIMVGINTTIAEIIKLAGKTNLTLKNIQDAFKRNLKPMLLYSLTKSKSPSLSLAMAETTSDNILIKTASLLELQERGRGVKRGNKYNAFPPNTRYLEAADYWLGNPLFLSKTHPTGKCRINPFVLLDTDSGKLLPPEAIEDSMLVLNSLFSGRMNTNSNELLELINNSEVADIGED